MLRNSKIIILGTVLFFLIGVAVNLVLTSAENAKLGDGGGSVQTLGSQRRDESATSQASQHYTADRSNLVGDAYAYFRLVELDVQVADYDAIAAHVNHVTRAAARDEVAILAIDALLNQECMTEASVDSDPSKETAEQRRESMKVILDLVNSLHEPMLRSAYMTRLAEVQYRVHNRMSGDNDKGWEQLKAKAEAEATKIAKLVWWQNLDYRYWLTLVITACGLVLSIIVKEVVTAYSKSMIATRLKLGSGERAPASEVRV